MQMESTYWLEKLLKMISLYVNALLCTLQHIVIHAMQLSGVNSPNCLFNFLYRVRDLRPRWSTTLRAGFSCATLYFNFNNFNTVVIILNNVKPNGIPLRSETLSYMWNTLALMDLMMVVDWPKHVVLLNLYKTPCNQDPVFVVFDSY